MSKTETEYVILTVFLIGIIVAAYYLISIFAAEVSPAYVIEKMILVGIIISILIVVAIVLYKQIELRDKVNMLTDSGVAKQVKTRTAKDAKNEMMRIYRDLGALKIIMQDGIIEKKAYEAEKKELEKRVDELKKEHEKLKKK